MIENANTQHGQICDRETKQCTQTTIKHARQRGSVFMRHAVKIIKGSLVGMGSILPGISGSMVAAILHIYHELIEALDNVTRQPLRAIASVWQYIVGVILGLLLGFFVIRLVFEVAPLPVTLLFIGFIIGGIRGLNREATQAVKIHLSWLAAPAAGLVMLAFLFVTEQTATVGSLAYLFILFVIGALTAISLIIPGLSAATMLMALGYYHILLTVGNDFIAAVFSGDYSAVAQQMPMVLVIALGGIVTLLLMGKVMALLLKRYRSIFYYAVLGVVVVSPINILVTLDDHTTVNYANTAWYLWLIGILLFLAGYAATQWLAKNRQHKEEIK
ncbi:MAG: DUF368 domain-containing protein [Acholeplasmataceae bacterium]|nr:MAG: DUF368 domain-containing protein [Acholeplasmataceae bacterium]